MTNPARMMDANANRAREALRVLEDVSRFVLDDEGLSRKAKSLRHDLAAALECLPRGWLESNRDTPRDVGVAISTSREQSRNSMDDIAVVAGKRLSEALRVLEEGAKLLNAELASQFEQLRYRGYTFEADLLRHLGTGCAKQWRLCLLLTEALCFQPWREVLEAAVSAGVDCVQVREKEMDAAELVDRVREVISIARPRGASVIVNDRVDIALAAEADGVHLGTADLPLADARRMVGRTLLLGASTHHMQEAELAVSSGADYCGVGAMFTSTLKPSRTPAGTAYLKSFLDRYPHMPHLAIGGISPENVGDVAAAGARGIAVSTCICQATDPGAVARALLNALDATRRSTGETATGGESNLESSIPSTKA